MKKILTTILMGITTIALAYAVYTSSQVGVTPANGKVLQTNGTTSTWVSTSSLGISGGTGVTNAYASTTFVTYPYGTSTYYLSSNPSGYITSSSLTPYSTFAYNSSTYPTFTYATNTYYFASNPLGYITSSSLTPYSTFAYGSSTFPTFSYASNTFAISSGGTNGYLARWLSGTTLGTSTILDDGVNAGVNATSSLYEFFIKGDTIGTHSPFAVASSSGAVAFHIDQTNNVAIGTTTAPYLFTVETGSTTNNTGINLAGWVNNFLQINVQNRSTSTLAESGFSAISNIGTATTSFVWMGINNSLFSNPQAYTTGSFGDTNLLGLGNDMYIANGSTTGKMFFFTGGTGTSTSANNRMTISSNGYVGIGTTSPTDKLSVNGNITPSLDITYGMGSSTKRWLNTFSQFIYGTSSLITNASSSNFALGGLLYDSTNATGTANQFLLSTGTSTKWTTVTTTGVTNAYASSSFVGAGSGANGKVARWLSTTTQGVGVLLDNATVAGVNATSSTVTFNVQGSGGTPAQFAVASSGAAVSFRIEANSWATFFATTSLSNATATRLTVGRASASSDETVDVQGSFAVESSANNDAVFVSSGGQMGISTSTFDSAFGFDIATTTRFNNGFQVKKRVVGYASASSITVNSDTTDIATSTINQTCSIANPTGTPTDSRMFELRALATTTQTITFGTGYASSTDLNFPSNVASGTTRFLFEYDINRSKWDLVGKIGAFNP